MGLDVRAVKADTSEKHLIQAKRYGPDVNVGGPEVQQYALLRMHEPEVTDVFVVTTGGFTEAAQQTAARYDVELVDGDRLVELVEEIKQETGKTLLDSFVDPQPGDDFTYQGSENVIYTIPEHSFVGELAWFTAGGIGALLIISGMVGFLVTLFVYDYVGMGGSAVAVVIGISVYHKARKELLPRQREG